MGLKELQYGDGKQFGGGQKPPAPSGEFKTVESGAGNSGKKPSADPRAVKVKGGKK